MVVIMPTTLFHMTLIFNQLKHFVMNSLLEVTGGRRALSRTSMWSNKFTE